MKLHLPLGLLSAVLACYASASFVTYAEETTEETTTSATTITLNDMWQFESHTTTYTWSNDATGTDLSDGANWVNGSAPATKTFWVFDIGNGNSLSLTSSTDNQNITSDGGVFL
jgi:hypothetical protein